MIELGKYWLEVYIAYGFTILLIALLIIVSCYSSCRVARALDKLEQSSDES